MTSWHSYPKIFNLGHSALTYLFVDDVIVEEKIDGSQFSFGVFDGALKCRSKGKELEIEAPEKMFNQAVNTAKELVPLLKNGYTYRAEYLQKPKHNSLTYSRIPTKHLIIFDISPGEEQYLTYEEKVEEAARLGLEVVPLIYKGKVENFDVLAELLKRQSVLGGAEIEGMVVKNYSRFGKDGKILLGKYVSENFKELHNREWKKSNPQSGDVLTTLMENCKTKARWHKAVQHLQENGKLTKTLKDIGPLIIEAKTDAKQELEDYIKNELFKWAWPSIERSITNGMPEWYKTFLAKGHFE